LLSAVVSQSDPNHAPCAPSDNAARDLTPARSRPPQHRHRRDRRRLRDEHHRRDLGVAAGFVALRHNHVDPVIRVALRVLRLTRERRDLHAVVVGLVDHVLGRRSERVCDKRDGMCERDVDVAVCDIVSPAQHSVRCVAFRERRELEPLHQLVDVTPVVRVDH
jgi:hypothetical protein